MPALFQLRPSRILSWLLICVTLLAVAMVWMMPLLWWQAFLASAALLIYQYFNLSKTVWLDSQNSVVAVRMRSDGFVLLMRSGAELEGRIAASTFITPLLTVLNVRLNKQGMRSVVFLPDSLPAEDYRRLRVLLKWGKQELS